MQLAQSKRYIIHSLYTGKDDVVGIIHSNKDNKLYCEVLIPKNRLDFPINLLGPHRDWERDDTPTIKRWLESRVVPPTRQFLRQMLDDYKIPEWDLDTLLRLNQGKVCDDKFYIEIEETNE